MPRRRFPLPILPSHPQRRVLQQALNGAYRRVHFTPPQTCNNIAMFFGLILPLLLETADILSGESFDLKICPFLILLMRHLVQGQVKKCKIFLSLKAAPLDDTFIHSMKELFESRLEAFNQRGSGFSLLSVDSMEWDVTHCSRIPFLVGHGKPTLPPKLAAKRSVVNIDNGSGHDFFRYVIYFLYICKTF